MLPKAITAYKKLGETPLECLESARLEHGFPANLPMTYAGRLDPMAEGLMILLLGDECKNKEEYLGLDKTYEFEVLVGFKTDTDDLLGLVKEMNDFEWSGLPTKIGQEIRGPEKSFVSETIKQFIGTFTQKYPAFSSKTVAGKQLFQLSKDDELPDELPEHEVTISKLSCSSTMIREKEELHQEILRRISLVHGDFRQEEIIAKWNEAFKNVSQKEFMVFSCIAECSSGTYIRQLVADIGEKMGVPMTTYSIKRTVVGAYILHDIDKK